MMNAGRDKGVTLLVLALGLTLIASRVEARIYSYVDDHGRKAFVDSLDKVPQQYRNQIKVLDEPSDHLSPEARAAQEAERAKREQQDQLKHHRQQVEDLLKSMETPVQVTQNRVLVPVTVVYGGRSARVRMVLDTGATNTVFHKDALKNLPFVTQPGGKARVAGGGVISTETVSFDRIEVGPYKVANVRALVIDHQGPSVGSDGLLGMDFLRNVHYRIDYDRQQILWEPARYAELETMLHQLDAGEQSDNAPAAGK